MQQFEAYPNKEIHASKRSLTFIGLWPFMFLSLFTFESHAEGTNLVTGITKLTVYSIPKTQSKKFLSFAESTAHQLNKANSNMYLFHEQHTSTNSHNAYFVVEFPDTIEQMTEPNTASYPFVSKFGEYRSHIELSRQKASWCSTLSIEPNKLKYAHAQYLWLKSDALQEVDFILQKRADLIKRIYGSGSDGVSAFEGFMPMSAPFGVMLVHFSNEVSIDAANHALKKDLNKRHELAAWLELEIQLRDLIVREDSRTGTFISNLSVGI